jgi:transposase
VAATSGCPQCEELRREIAQLREEIRELRARLKLDSTNSSKPPSSDPPGAGTKPPADKKKRRRRGAQPGHEGKSRPPFAPDQVDRTETHDPTACHLCGSAVTVDPALDPVRHQVVDIPPATAQVTEHVCGRGVCPCCGVITTAPLPPDVPSGIVGPRLQAVLALLVGRYRLSRREAQDAVVALFGPKAEFALGTISALESRTSTALEAAYREAENAVRKAAVVCADETSFRRATQLTWLWTACTHLVSFFRIDRQRSKAAFRRLLPEVSGVLSTDRYGAYGEHPANRRQLCWAHLKRNFQELVDRGGAAAPLGCAGLRACADVVAASLDHREGRLRFASLAQRLAPTRKALLLALEDHSDSPDKKARAMARSLGRCFVSLWTFTRWQGVESTNNLAEREIRPAVLWRKNSFGCQSRNGERFVERMLTVNRTLRHQKRHLLDFLEQTIRAHAAGRRPPSLIRAC